MSKCFVSCAGIAWLSARARLLLACVAWTSSFGVAVVMSSPAVPEVRVMDAAEEPAAAGSVMEAPVAKAAGPAGPPTPMMVPDEPNISGRTVHGVLLEGKELLEIPGRRAPCSFVVVHRAS